MKREIISWALLCLDGGNALNPIKIDDSGQFTLAYNLILKGEAIQLPQLQLESFQRKVKDLLQEWESDANNGITDWIGINLVNVSCKNQIHFSEKLLIIRCLKIMKKPIKT